MSKRTLIYSDGEVKATIEVDDTWTDKEVEDYVAKAVMEIQAEKIGIGKWLNVRGVDFSPREARTAADFSDLMESYGIDSEGLVDYIGESGLDIGMRLYLAETVPEEFIGSFLLQEDDERIITVARNRISGNNNNSKIIL